MLKKSISTFIAAFVVLGTFSATVSAAEPTPTGVSVSYDAIFEGSNVGIDTYQTASFNGVDLNILTSLSGGWDLVVKDNANHVVVGGYLDGKVSSLGNAVGKYSFKAPAYSAFGTNQYRVELVDMDGVMRAFDLFKVVKDVDLQVFNPSVFAEPDEQDDEDSNFNVANLPDISFLFPEAQVEGNVEARACTDLEDSFWAHDIINDLLERAIYPVVVEGNDVNCRPLVPVLRKEFTLWLLNAYRAEDLEDIEAFDADYDYSNAPFSDVDGTSPYDKYIVKAAELGIINGNPDGTFKPDAPINRAEVLKILLRSSHLFNASAEEVAELNADTTPMDRFDDVDDDSVWYYSYLHYAAQNNVNIIEGRQYVQGGVSFRKADMGEGVLFSEAAKILFLAKDYEDVEQI